MSQKVLLTSKEVNIILHRLACQLIEKHLDFSNTILIGIQPRGTFLAERLKELLENEYKIDDVATFCPQKCSLINIYHHSALAFSFFA